MHVGLEATRSVLVEGMPSPKKYQVAEINKWASESVEAKSRILWSRGRLEDKGFSRGCNHPSASGTPYHGCAGGDRLRFCYEKWGIH